MPDSQPAANTGTIFGWFKHAAALSLDAKTPEGARVERRGGGKDLQCHSPLRQPELLGLVDDPHTSPPDLAHDAVFAQDVARL